MFCYCTLQVAAGAITSALLRYSAKDHYFRAALCRMCVDVQDASTNVAKYEEAFPSFADSRECKLVKVGWFTANFCWVLH